MAKIWVTSGNLNTARTNAAGMGTLTAGLSAGGDEGAATNSNNTEEYDGTSWANGGDLNTARRGIAGAGTQTAGLTMGGTDGTNSVVTEEYDGATWSTAGDLNTAKQAFTGCGTQTAALAPGGFAATYNAETEEYNGTAWSLGGDLAVARYGLSCFGTESSAVTAGGNTGSNSVEVEEYNGTAWSAGGDLSVAKRNMGSAGSSDTSGIIFGGFSTENIDVAEEYNGTTWSSVDSLNAVKRENSGAGDTTNALSFGGFTNAVSNGTEEYREEISSPSLSPSASISPSPSLSPSHSPSITPSSSDSLSPSSSQSPSSSDSSSPSATASESASVSLSVSLSQSLSLSLSPSLSVSLSNSLSPSLSPSSSDSPSPPPADTARIEYFLDLVNIDSDSGLNYEVNTPTKWDPFGTGYVLTGEGYLLEIFFGTILNHPSWPTASRFRAFVSFRENEAYTGANPGYWSGGRVGYIYSSDLKTWVIPNLGLITIDGNTNNAGLTDETFYHVSAVYQPLASSDMRYVLQLGEFTTGTDAPGNIRLFKVAAFGGDYPTSTPTGFKTISHQDDNWDPGMSLVQRSDSKWLSMYQVRNYPGSGYGNSSDLRDLHAFLSSGSDLSTATWADQGKIISAVNYNNQKYGGALNAVDGYLLGLITRHNQQNGLEQIELFEARDSNGVTDQQLKKTDFIPNGTPGSWDSGMMFHMQGILKKGNTWYIPYAGYNKPHPSDQHLATTITPVRGALGFVQIGWRRVGSIERQSSGQGYVIAERIEPGGDLFINCDATGGKIEVELLHPWDNSVIPNFSKENCDDIDIDTYKHEVTWGGRSVPKNRDYKIKFYLTFITDTVKLYSYEVEAPIAPSVVWGRASAVSENTARPFYGNWTGNGSIELEDDEEVIALNQGEYMISEVVDIGNQAISIHQNVYDSGDDVTIYYRTSSTIEGCKVASFTPYTTPFNPNGYIQIMLFSSLGTISSSPSKSVSPTPSLSASLSPSYTSSYSSSISLSVSRSPSLSFSLSPSPSQSTSLSVSPSASASITPSSSVSASLSLSPSKSASASMAQQYVSDVAITLEASSPSASPSPTPSSSFSPSPSVSVSVSPSVSVSSSISLSPSLSQSPSSSASSSISLSPSSSTSSSPSHGFELYSRGAYVALPSNNDDLTTLYTSTEVDDVATNNNIRVAQEGRQIFLVHQFKDYVGDVASCILIWEGKVSLEPTSSAAFLQIYNHNTSTWQTLVSDNTSPPDTDFVLNYEVTDLTNYKDNNKLISCRIYQET